MLSREYFSPQRCFWSFWRVNRNQQFTHILLIAVAVKPTVGAATMARSTSTRACYAILANLGKGPGMALHAAHDSPPIPWYRCGTRGSFRIRQEGGLAWAGGALNQRNFTERGHPSHVEPGSEEAAHHLNAKVESSTFEVFQALYEREYAERMMVARLMNKLAGVVETKAQVRAERSSRTEEDAFKVKGPFAMGMQLPDIITHDVVVDMVTRMAKGKERIHLDSFKRIIDTASPMLAKDPNIQIIENDQKVVVVGDLHGSIDDLLLCFQRSSWPVWHPPFLFPPPPSHLLLPHPPVLSLSPVSPPLLSSSPLESPFDPLLPPLPSTALPALLAIPHRPDTPACAHASPPRAKYAPENSERHHHLTRPCRSLPPFTGG